MMDGFKATIGIECHVQLKTVTKLFSGAANDAREAAPNTKVNHIDFGLPGALPVLNREAVALAARAALALKTTPQLFSTFDRKHYFYPDLPMGYQITQYDQPIIIGGKVEFNLNGEKKVVRITRAHLEADAGKSIHPAGQQYSLVDLNRAGTPLLEIVSEPDMHTAAEAKAYTRELYLIMRYADVTEGDLYHGNMRFDVNVSVSRDERLGTRSETKNLNSFRSVEKAVDYEIHRQIELIKSGKTVIQETRGWDDAKQKTVSQRTKENADDYRYMPDPDLPPIIIDQSFIQTVQHSMPASPAEWRNRLAASGLDDAQIDVLIEADVDLPKSGYLALISYFSNDNSAIRQIANLLVNTDIPTIKAMENEPLSIDREIIYKEVIKLVRDGKLSSTNAKELVRLCLSREMPKDIAAFAELQGLLQKSDANELSSVVDKVLLDNPKAVDDVKRGEVKVIGFLIGQVMAQTKGQANPGLVKQLIESKLKH